MGDGWGMARIGASPYDRVPFVGGLDDAKREALEVMRGRGFEIGEEVWREGLFKYRDVYIARW